MFSFKRIHCTYIKFLFKRRSLKRKEFAGIKKKGDKWDVNFSHELISHYVVYGRAFLSVLYETVIITVTVHLSPLCHLCSGDKSVPILGTGP